ncbi:MAG: hypothetical protein K2I46_05980 [Clostridia bacterium]|nr:hypothetical protein [Clostridia bacterium]MDE6472200.1 hypothetical protein [Clostridia bacterium]
MKKFYPFKQKSWIYILSILAIIILIIFMIVKILSVAGVGNLVSYHHTEDIVAIVIMGVVAIILAIFVFLCGLSLGKNHVFYVMGFLVERIKYEDIIVVNMDTAGEFMLIYYKVKRRGMVKDKKTGLNADVIMVNCKNQYFDNIIDGLRKKHPSIVVEFVTAPPKGVRKR